MSKNGAKWLVVILLFSLISCGTKFYYKNDYSFYDKDFSLDDSSFLRTDGLYVLEREWNKKNDGLAKPEKYEAYKFYKTGQVNIILVDSLRSQEGYFDLMQSQIHEYGKGKNKSTLFQGYFKVKNTRIIIQQVNVPLRQFYYSYGYLKEGKLILVKKSITGDGEFREDYFTGIHNEIYIFLPLNTPDNLMPNW